MILNKQKSESFNNAWRDWVASQKSKGKFVPEHPSDGWLQETAARKDLCISLFKN